MTTDATGLYGAVALMGTTPASPGTAWFAALKGNVITFRTGSYKVAGLYIPPFVGTGDPTEAYGVYIAEQMKGSAQSWSVFSAGAATKSKFEGRLMQGVPNAAPTDAHLGNGQATFYLDQSADKLMVRVRYDDGTLKTGEIALT